VVSYILNYLNIRNIETNGLQEQSSAGCNYSLAYVVRRLGVNTYASCKKSRSTCRDLPIPLITPNYVYQLPLHVKP
jgi:hypothetical protein